MIKTFVYFDIETTGFGNAKITELSLVAVSLLDLLGLHDKLSDFKEENQEEYNLEAFYHKLNTLVPRVMNKLTLCFNPDKMILPAATKASAGLTNSMLEDQAKFDSDTVDLITAYLNRLPGPVCLVAHKGHGFDFPILRREIKEAGASLQKDFFCVDTLDGIRNISDEGKIERREFSYSDANAKKKRRGPPENFKQPTLHKYLLGVEPSSTHTSEADSLSLMRVTATLGKDWTKWANNNAKPL